MDEYISREAVLQTLQKANIGGYITERLLEIPFADVQPVNQWISIKEKLPPEDESVLIYTIMGMCVAARWDDRFFVSKTASIAKYDVTHWMPLPEPPKDGDTNVSVKQCAADHRQLAEWLKELKKAKAMILDTSYTLEVMCDKVSTKIGCERCTYYDEETHGCEVRKWIDKMRTFCKGKKVV